MMNVIKLTTKLGLTPREGRFILSNPDLEVVKRVITTMWRVERDRFPCACKAEASLCERLDELRDVILDVEQCV